MAHFFCIFHALSFELNFFQLEFPFKKFKSHFSLTRAAKFKNHYFE